MASKTESSQERRKSQWIISLDFSDDYKLWFYVKYGNHAGLTVISPSLFGSKKKAKRIAKRLKFEGEPKIRVSKNYWGV